MSYSATLLVPSVYSNIQDAIDAANPGDEVLVDDGTYQENILIEKDIILRSVNGADHTTIDGSLGRGLGSTVVIRPESLNPHKPIVEIDGFSIINGKGTDLINNTIGNLNANGYIPLMITALYIELIQVFENKYDNTLNYQSSPSYN